MEDPCQGETLLQSDKAMQPMQCGEALRYHQTVIGNIKQRKRTNFHMTTLTKVHSQIWLTNCISLSQRTRND